MRLVLLLTLVSIFAALPAWCDDCGEPLPAERSSEGCLQELGAFPLEQPSLEAFSFFDGVLLEDVLRHLGTPTSRQTTRGMDPREPGIELDTVDLSYPSYRLRLGCFLDNSRCWLKEFELTDPAVNIGCGLHVGLPLVDFLKATKRKARTSGQQPPADRKVRLGWEKYWCEQGIWFASHGYITLHTSTEGFVKRISWSYFAD